MPILIVVRQEQEKGKTMSYAIFQQGIVTNNRYVPGKIISSGIETEEEAYQVRHDLAIDGIYTSGFGWNETTYNAYIKSMQVVHLA